MAQAKYKSLVDRIANEIRRGILSPGTRLPTHRKLAVIEGVSLGTATRVYAELEAMSLVSGETGRGTFVRETALPRGMGVDQQAAATGLIDLNFNYPSLPEQAEFLRTALRQLSVAGDLESLLRYQPHAGRSHEREIVARHLASRSLSVSGEQVAIVSGAQHGLATTVMAMLQAGDVVAVDALTYPGFKVLAEAHRLHLASIEATPKGPDLDALEAMCKRRRVRALYVMPTLHNPMGWVMSAGERQRLVAIARRYELLIIEDAAYAFLAPDSPAPLAALAPESTVYVSGLSKSVATGLRVGFIASPAAWMPRIERAIRATTWNTPGVMTALACAWMEDGTVARLETQKRKDAMARQVIAANALAGLRHVGHPASYFLWLPLVEEVRADRVATALQTEGISVSTAEPFATTKHVPHALRLALGSVELDALREALNTVVRVIKAQPV